MYISCPCWSCSGFGSEQGGSTRAGLGLLPASCCLKGEWAGKNELKARPKPFQRRGPPSPGVTPAPPKR